MRQVNVIKEGLNVVEEEIKQHKASKATDPFGKIMQDFYDNAKELLDKLEEEVNQMKKRFENMCSYFGEEPNKADPVSQVTRIKEREQREQRDACLAISMSIVTVGL